MSDRVVVEGVAVSPEHLIDGERVSSATTFEDRSPLDWSWKLTDVASGDATTADAAVTAAAKAFPAWAELGPQRRGELLRRLADAMAAPYLPLPRADAGAISRTVRAAAQAPTLRP